MKTDAKPRPTHKNFGVFSSNSKNCYFQQRYKFKNHKKIEQKPPFMQPSNQKVNDYATLAWLKYHGRLCYTGQGRLRIPEIRF